VGYVQVKRRIQDVLLNLGSLINAATTASGANEEELAVDFCETPD
jgi:hypothetical protein